MSTLSRILAVELTPRHSKPEKGDHWIAKRDFVATTPADSQATLSISKGDSVIVTRASSNLVVYMIAKDEVNDYTRYKMPIKEFVKTLKYDSKTSKDMKHLFGTEDLVSELTPRKPKLPTDGDVITVTLNTPVFNYFNKKMYKLPSGNYNVEDVYKGVGIDGITHLYRVINVKKLGNHQRITIDEKTMIELLRHGEVTF